MKATGAVAVTALLLLAGCTQSIPVETAAAGVEVSCADRAILSFASLIDRGSGDALCDVNVAVRYLNTDDYICDTYGTVYEDGTAAVGCPGLADINETRQLRVIAEFYEHRTTNKLGEDEVTLYWSP